MSIQSNSGNQSFLQRFGKKVLQKISFNNVHLLKHTMGYAWLEGSDPANSFQYTLNIHTLMAWKYKIFQKGCPSKTYQLVRQLIRDSYSGTLLVGPLLSIPSSAKVDW